ncbi:MAG TPA: aldehyde dehydrogenase [Puia sp.]|jgi:aldehyde dehydrogenase (NAD+)|nr:aldehyde dehydrogenase [Puia sp.]
MDNPDHNKELLRLRSYFQSGATRSYGWRRQQLLLLKQAILRHEDEIHQALYTDLKKSPEEAYGTETGLVLAEINTTLRNLRKWMRPRAVRTNLVNLPSSSRIYRDPLGTVLIIAPWNYPFQLSLIPLAGAIAGGNCVVLKPSELAPATAAILEKILTGIFPGEFIRVIPGDGAVVVPALIRSFRFDHIFFTGSISVGRSIYQLAAQDLVPVTLELGGKSPVVVESDADIKTAARRIALGKFTNAGQTCIAPDYLLLHADIKEKLLGQLQKTLVEFYGEKAEESYDYGKIINEKRFDKLVSYLPQGRIITGGRYDRSALFISPTILEEVAPDQPLMTEEIFGPLLPVFTYRTMEEALAIIQRNPDPLAFYLFTTDGGKQKVWIERLSFGGGCINNTEWQFANYHLPFGGIGLSGMGAYHGKYTFDTFTHAKPVMRTPVRVDPAIKYPPFNGKLKWFKLFIR